MEPSKQLLDREKLEWRRHNYSQQNFVEKYEHIHDEHIYLNNCMLKILRHMFYFARLMLNECMNKNQINLAQLNQFQKNLYIPMGGKHI